MTGTIKESVPRWEPFEVMQSWKTGVEFIDYYNGRAETYEESLAKHGWKGPELLAHAFLNLDIPRSARILDLCAGPGLLGVELHKHGYCNIDALDGVSKMLEKCRNLGNVYSNLFEHVIKGDQPFPCGCADCDAILISSGVCPGRLSFHDLRPIAKIIKKGGVLGSNVTVRKTSVENFTEEELKKNATSLVKDGALEPIDGYYPKKEEYFFHYEGQIYMTRVVC